jgi:hypothetical protein
MRAGALAAGLLVGTVVTGQAAVPRLLVIDLPYARVWEGTVRALSGYPLARASDGVVETARVERAPRPDEPGLERVAERVTVRVEAMADKVTRITVTVAAEALRDGHWEALEGSPATARAVLDRIRAAVANVG